MIFQLGKAEPFNKEDAKLIFEALGFKYRPYGNEFCCFNSDTYGDVKPPTISIETLEDLKSLCDKVLHPLIVDFSELTITIYDGYIE